MIEALTEIIRNIVIIVFITTIVDLMLPSSTMRPYIKMVTGLFVIATILTPIIGILDEDNFLIGWDIGMGEAAQLEDILEKGNAMGLSNTEGNSERLVEKVELQIEGLLSIVQGVVVQDIQVQLKKNQAGGDYGAVETIEIWVSPVEAEIRVSPVIIKIGEEVQPKETVVEQHPLVDQIQSMISSYYGVSEDKVEVYIQKGDE